MNPVENSGPADSVSPAGPPVCYRHQDRETHIRCARCDRPVCTDCMVSASVGFQCPECVREGSRSVRQARTIAGGTVRSGGATGVVTKVLLGLNLAMFLLVLTAGNSVVVRFMQIGIAVDQRGQLLGVADGEWYRLFTSAFLHQQYWHILFNMMSLWLLGPWLEEQFGRVRFLAVYLLSALGGSVAAYLFAPAGQGSLGASGAIFGLIGATIVMELRLRHDMRPIMLVLAYGLAITLVGYHWIDWRAHLGGLAVGTLSALCIVYAPRRHRVLVQLAAFVVVAGVLVLLVMQRTAELT